MQIKECDPYGGSTPGAMTFTRLPIDAGPDEPVSECLFFPGSKEVLMKLRGFPQPLLRPTAPTFRVTDIPGKGKGAFSTRVLKMGDLILNERPLLISARGVSASHPEGLTEAQYFQHSLNTLEEYVEIAIKRMRPANKAAFMALTNSHKEDGSGPIVGIMRTNSVACDGLSPDMKGDLASYSAVCKDISRLNHSCSPNTAARFDIASLSYQLYAVRDIAAGEELTYQYTPVNYSAVERQKGLNSYDFVCACTACLDAPASDARRAALAAFKPDVMEWVYDRTRPDDWLLVKCREHLELIEREGLQQIGLHFDIVKAMMEAYICLGDAQAASEWAARLKKFQWDDERTDVEALLNPASPAYKKHMLWRVRFDGGFMQSKLGKEFAALALASGGSVGSWGMVFPMK
ncbi:hypothetical protein B0H15DRAFT_551011 [Mycena belliarum]|uniref:SET domain-containing protein n=1 Tax=Mycena belliarum TaxID=1033014 RepID=A0AAD6UE96_9AGAR|nr:hypothetical protein B0H15DRAFT_551011 [Mycena belliae]